jgi:hypothetical protein
MKYNCITCNYSTDNKYSFERHVKNIRHIEKVEQLSYDCKYCNVNYLRNSSLLKHMQICDKKQDYELNLEHKYQLSQEQIKTLEKQLDIQLKQSAEKYAVHEKQSIEKYSKLEHEYIELKKNHAELNKKYFDEIHNYMNDIKKNHEEIKQDKNKAETRYDTLVHNSGTIINNSLQTVNKTVSALTYINQNFQNAPPLLPLPDFSAFNKPKEGQLVEEMIQHYKKKKLAQYIGDVYAEQYVSDDPSKQPLWNKDNARLTYYVRIVIKGTKINPYQWVTDKKGLRVIEDTIKPILKFLAQEVKKCSKLAMDGKLQVEGNILAYMQSCAEIGIQICDKNLENEILKYIAPKFDIARAQLGNNFLELDVNKEDPLEIENNLENHFEEPIKNVPMEIVDITDEIEIESEGEQKEIIKEYDLDPNISLMQRLEKFEMAERNKKIIDGSGSEEEDKPRPTPKLKALPKPADLEKEIAKSKMKDKLKIKKERKKSSKKESKKDRKKSNKKIIIKGKK